ncbi:MAG: hypothetical protein WBL06_05915 [Pseudolysinimonas sp.]|uniref:hypothetical protein n=1 Tax=Pseudolysinimonas sp. TaxID=2680009 RepID=UPI003C735D92
MPISPFDDVADISLATDEALLERVRDLVEGAYRQQLWFMFLDAGDRQLPLLIPFDVPDRPDEEHHDRLDPFVADLVDEVRPRSIVVVLERPGRHELTPGDREWFAVVDRACRAAGVVRRGPILAHDDGFRWIAPEDLAGTR